MQRSDTNLVEVGNELSRVCQVLLPRFSWFDQDVRSWRTGSTEVDRAGLPCSSPRLQRLGPVLYRQG